MSKHRLSGVEVILIVATFIVVGFVAYAVYHANRQAIEDPNLESQAVIESNQLVSQVPDAPKIINKADLDEAIEALDEVNLEAGLDSSEDLELEAASF